MGATSAEIVSTSNTQKEEEYRATAFFAQSDEGIGRWSLRELTGCINKVKLKFLQDSLRLRLKALVLYHKYLRPKLWGVVPLVAQHQIGTRHHPELRSVPARGTHDKER